MSQRFEHHARTVTLLTFASRVTGLARDAALSRVFGAGLLMDAFFFAFMIPNLFRRLFGEGALAAAFLPVYSKLDRDDPEQARRFASLTFAMLTVALGGLVFVGEVILFTISHFLGHENLAVWLMMVMLPYMPLVCMVAILGAMLQVHGRFGPTAAAPMLLNVMIVFAAVGLFFVLDPADERQRFAHISAVAACVSLSGVLQVAWSLLVLKRQNVKTSKRQNGLDVADGPFLTFRRFDVLTFTAARSMWAQALPMIVGLGVLQINTLFDGFIASYPSVVGATIFGISYPLDEGAMAAVSFSQRLYQFPLGVFGIAVATAIFPLLARLSDDEEGFTGALRRGLRLVVFIGLPASVGLMLVREPLTAVILQGGDFTAEDTRRVAFVLLGYAPAIWAYSMIHVLTRAFYARSDARTPVRIAIGVVGLNLALNCTLIWTPLREAGLAWSTAICAVVQVALLLALVGNVQTSKRPNVQRGQEPGAASRLGGIDREVVASWMKTLLVSAIMAAVVLTMSMLMRAFATVEDVRGWSQSLVELALLVGVGGTVVFFAALALRMPELPWALGRGETSKRPNVQTSKESQ